MSKKIQTKNLRSGLLKGGIEIARDYARDHFVYGLRTKEELIEEHKLKARRVEANFSDMEDWFQEILHTRRCMSVKGRKQVKYISVNCREHSLNPIYKMWKACSFTTNDIMFFFFLLDYLSTKKEPVKLASMYGKYYWMHKGGFQPGAAQKWLKKKGLPSGIIINEAEHDKYSLAPIFDLSELRDLLFYYSEIAPCGVVGSFILDKTDIKTSPFSYKQHYIGQAFDCEVLCNALHAIKKGEMLELDYLLKNKSRIKINALPLKIYSSTHNGRQYLIAWNEEKKSIFNYRIDRIKKISTLDLIVSDANVIRESFDNMKKHIWGVSLGNGELVHVEFLVKVDENEGYIINRLYREKRCGIVSPVENRPGIFKFSADVYDAHEMFPWIRTFICRIIELKISDRELEELFWDSFYAMYKVYSREGEESWE